MEWYSDKPQYAHDVVVLVTGRTITVTWDTRPGCPGSFTSDKPGCDARPDHIVTYATNPSGLPGQQTLHHVPVCYRHLHGVLKHAEETSVVCLCKRHTYQPEIGGRECWCGGHAAACPRPMHIRWDDGDESHEGEYVAPAGGD